MNTNLITKLLLLTFFCFGVQGITSQKQIEPTTLHDAARLTDHYNQLKELIAQGADVNELDGEGNSPLYMTLLSGNSNNDSADKEERFKKAKLLIQNGAKVDLGGDGLPLIFYSVNNFKTLKLLVTAGANVNEKNTFIHLMSRGGDTPLHWASLHGSLKAVKYLIASNAYITAEDNCGWTPLHCAIFSGNTAIVKYYLANGMDKSITTKKEFEVLWGGFAENPYPANATLLEVAKIAQSNAARHEKIAKDYDEIIRLLEGE